MAEANKLRSAADVWKNFGLACHLEFMFVLLSEFASVRSDVHLEIR